MLLPRRYDTALMRPPDAHGAVDASVVVTLRALCEGRALPAPPAPLQAASIGPCVGLDAAACVLDGSHELARRGRWRGLLWRLQIVWREQLAGRPAGHADPWDCGWWREGPLGPARAFRPRRATLLMLRQPAPAATEELLATLREQSPAYVRPLRVLVVSVEPVAGLLRL